MSADNIDDRYPDPGNVNARLRDPDDLRDPEQKEMYELANLHFEQFQEYMSRGSFDDAGYELQVAEQYLDQLEQGLQEIDKLTVPELLEKHGDKDGESL